jgi:hypothetical protein
VNRRVEVCPLEDGYLVKAWCKTAPEAAAVQAAAHKTPPAAAFTPALSAGEAFDSAEVVPLAGGSVGNAMPPNCDGNAHSGQEPTQAGQVLAQARHEAAISGAECNGTACLMTRGAND